MTNPLPARALLIGVSHYLMVSSLPAAVLADVKDVAAMLEDPTACGYAAGTVEVLTDDAATRVNVVTALESLAKTLTPDDSMLLYFSGHGHRIVTGSDEESYLLTYDSDLQSPASTALRDVELLELLSAIPSRRQVIILDACHAGAVGTLKSMDDTPKGFASKGVERLAAGRGRVVLASSRDHEVSIIKHGARNSLFTESVLRALRGAASDRGDGLIGVFDLFDYIAKDVSSLANQHPVFKADGLEGNIAIARRPRAAGAKAGSTPHAWTVDELARVMASLYPLGPSHSEIWSRSGGDVSRLQTGGHGLAQWHSAIGTIARGGGGTTAAKLIEVATTDYSDNEDLRRLSSLTTGGRQ